MRLARPMMRDDGPRVGRCGRSADDATRPSVLSGRYLAGILTPVSGTRFDESGHG